MCSENKRYLDGMSLMKENRGNKTPSRKVLADTIWCLVERSARILQSAQRAIFPVAGPRSKWNQSLFELNLSSPRKCATVINPVKQQNGNHHRQADRLKVLFTEFTSRQRGAARVHETGKHWREVGLRLGKHGKDRL
mmetsp:Transcript_10082/g.18518  ORF Transcript_10082/g.18518 Transcript_10082/m.18518 type:complete len:137 (+) Transcript_10082:105-515(+)